MLVKDQIKIRMDQLDMSVNELAKLVGVSGQSVRHWLAGRSFPGKSKINLLNEALTVKLDYSQGESGQGITVEQALEQDALLAIRKLPPELQQMFIKLANAYVEHRL